jgi:putative flippase GtrA
MPKTNSKKRKALSLGWEFIKLQIAGNIPFWGTYGINALLDKGFNVDKYQALLVATVLANAVFFVVDDRWVFKNSRGKRKESAEVWKFVIFMSFSALLTFNITWQLYSLLGISTYIGQFISAALSILWTFIGLRFWVFAPLRKKSKKTVRAPRRKLAAARR